MDGLLFWHRLQFGFTATFHYLFPQLTMGLALVIVLLKGLALWKQEPRFHTAARFWIRIFGLTFAVGVVTGIPLEFQFGTNWARFSRDAGGVVGQTLAMEGMFAFFLESTFLGLLVFGERKLGERMHALAAVALFLGSWLSGYFIVATNAFMQHPVGYQAVGGALQLSSFAAFVFNPWALVQYAHTMTGAVVTGAFVVAAVGAFWTLQGLHPGQARLNLRLGVALGLVASLAAAFPTGDQQGKLVARHQPVALAAMEGRWHSGPYAEVNLIGQPDVRNQRLENPVPLPGILSFIAYGSFSSDVRGLDAFPPDQWPTNIELLYYGFHIMVGLGTLFIALMGLSALLLWRGILDHARPVLWCLMLAFPFPFIANSAGWMVAELGRQPWLVFGLLRTADGTSHLVHPGQTIFTALGFAGLYLVLGLLYLFLVSREVAHGPKE
ncbi:cytochrome ubiquinol oxidase subunit I [Mesoterricola sediminis]|uniref:Cytochrome ubiquinol oxidase subunit I n=1 Tax=Mesoterricola sediminis TaxID=2927980 RepID=A0AA48GTY2_9BACT|nr:cytochrome ubiquinol oxidase subunit I [Mesoterricola sediminis]BDU75595.1 cytochrome ubiquinol oxidase subunit I [Mesoterricola sediminis]